MNIVNKEDIINDIKVISDWYYKEIGSTHKKRKYVQIMCLKCGWIGETSIFALKHGRTGQCPHCRDIGKRSKGNPQNTNIYEINGDITHIYTKKGDKFLIDTEDIDVAKQCYWAKHKSGYAIGQINKEKVRLHRLIMSKYGVLPNDPNMIIDHINKIRTDNRKENLNVIPKKLNPQNHSLYKTNKTGHSGISLCDNGKYRVKVSNKYIGIFETLEEAIKAREEAAHEYFEYLPDAS